MILLFREEIPPLLLKEANVTSEDELHVSVEDHRYEEYVPTKQKKKVFGGSGHLLGRYYLVFQLTSKLLI